MLGRDSDVPPSPEESGPQELSRYFVVTVARSLYAFPAEHVSFVDRWIEPVPVPTAPEHFLGVVHARGRIVTIVDIASVLRLSHGVPADRTESRLVVLELRRTPFGILADRAIGLTDVPSDAVQEDEADLTAGSFQTEAGVVTVLRTEELLDRLLRAAM